MDGWAPGVGLDLTSEHGFPSLLLSPESESVGGQAAGQATSQVRQMSPDEHHHQAHLLDPSGFLASPMDLLSYADEDAMFEPIPPPAGLVADVASGKVALVTSDRQQPTEHPMYGRPDQYLGALTSFSLQPMPTTEAAATRLEPGSSPPSLHSHTHHAQPSPPASTATFSPHSGSLHLPLSAHAFPPTISIAQASLTASHVAMQKGSTHGLARQTSGGYSPPSHAYGYLAARPAPSVGASPPSPPSRSFGFGQPSPPVAVAQARPPMRGTSMAPARFGQRPASSNDLLAGSSNHTPPHDSYYAQLMGTSPTAAPFLSATPPSERMSPLLSAQSHSYVHSGGKVGPSQHMHRVGHGGGFSSPTHGGASGNSPLPAPPSLSRPHSGLKRKTSSTNLVSALDPPKIGGGANAADDDDDEEDTHHGKKSAASKGMGRKTKSDVSLLTTAEKKQRRLQRKAELARVSRRKKKMNLAGMEARVTELRELIARAEGTGGATTASQLMSTKLLSPSTSFANLRLVSPSSSSTNLTALAAAHGGTGGGGGQPDDGPSSKRFKAPNGRTRGVSEMRRSHSEEGGLHDAEDGAGGGDAEDGSDHSSDDEDDNEDDEDEDPEEEETPTTTTTTTRGSRLGLNPSFSSPHLARLASASSHGSSPHLTRLASSSSNGGASSLSHSPAISRPPSLGPSPAGDAAATADFDLRQFVPPRQPSPRPPTDGWMGSWSRPHLLGVHRHAQESLKSLDQLLRLSPFEKLLRWVAQQASAALNANSQAPLAPAALQAWTFLSAQLDLTPSQLQSLSDSYAAHTSQAVQLESLRQSCIRAATQTRHHLARVDAFEGKLESILNEGARQRLSTWVQQNATYVRDQIEASLVEERTMKAAAAAAAAGRRGSVSSHGEMVDACDSDADGGAVLERSLNASPPTRRIFQTLPSLPSTELDHMIEASQQQQQQQLLQQMFQVGGHPFNPLPTQQQQPLPHSQHPVIANTISDAELLFPHSEDEQLYHGS